MALKSDSFFIQRSQTNACGNQTGNIKEFCKRMAGELTGRLRAVRPWRVHTLQSVWAAITQSQPFLALQECNLSIIRCQYLSRTVASWVFVWNLSIFKHQQTIQNLRWGFQVLLCRLCTVRLWGHQSHGSSSERYPLLLCTGKLWNYIHVVRSHCGGGGWGRRSGLCVSNSPISTLNI